MRLIHKKSRWQLVKDFVKDFLGIKRYELDYVSPAEYQPVGNYIYTTSEREFEKVALGLNYPVIAFRGLNDFYKEGVEFEKADGTSELFYKVKNSIDTMDKLCQLGNKNYNILITIILKIMPTSDTLAALEAAGFTIKNWKEILT